MIISTRQSSCQVQNETFGPNSRYAQRKNTGTTRSFLHREVIRMLDRAAAMSDTKAILKQIRDDLNRVRLRIQELTSEREQIDKEIAELTESERALTATESFYLHPKALGPTIPSSSVGVPIGHLTVAAACEVVFKETENKWMTLAELEMELNRRGKHTIKATIELALKAKSDRFERCLLYTSDAADE